MTAAYDPTARRLALVALSVSLVTLVLAGYGAFESRAHRQELERVARAMSQAMSARANPISGLQKPPPTFDPE